MNAFSFGVGYILAILMVHVSYADYQLLSEPKVTVIGDGPFYFKYGGPGGQNFLQMEIILKNIPSNVTEVFLSNNNTDKPDTTPHKVVNIENNTGRVLILGRLTRKEILVDLELRTETCLCSRKRVAHGKRRNNYWSTGTCLYPASCNIIVDFRNKCDEQQCNKQTTTPTTTTTTATNNKQQCSIIASQYICTIYNPTPDQSYKLYQNYGDNSYTGTNFLVTALKLKLVITLEVFDNNTSINIAKENIISSEKICFTAKEITKDYNVTKLMYSETSELQFSCQKYLSLDKVKYVHIGFINTTENKIKTFDITKEASNNVQNKTFKSKDNGTLLCCLYYVAEKIAEELVLTRFIVNKTLLIYQAPKSTENSVNRSTNLTVSGSKGQAMSSTQGQDNDDYSWLVYVAVTIIGVTVLVLALYMISKKFWFTKSQPDQGAGILDNQATQNQVEYSEIDFVNVANQPRNQNEESHYAHIMGVLHPF